MAAEMMTLGERFHGLPPPKHHGHHHFHGPPAPDRHFGVLLVCILFVAVYKVVRRISRHHKQQHPTIMSQLSQLSSSKSETTINPLLLEGRGRLASGQMQNAGVISKTEPDWMMNVPWSDWQIDQQDITLCQRPDGRLWELGAGASAKVRFSSMHYLTISMQHLMMNAPWSDRQIDQQDITLCQQPDGRLWELGASASAKGMIHL